MKAEVAESINHVNVAINDLEDVRRRDALNIGGVASNNGLPGDDDREHTDAGDRSSDE